MPVRLVQLVRACRRCRPCAFQVNEDHLKEIFGNYGKAGKFSPISLVLNTVRRFCQVKEATLAIDKAAGLPKGFELS